MIASTACRNVWELEVVSWYLDQPPAPLAHLTRLYLSGVTTPPDSGALSLRRLTEAAPRLEVFDCWSLDPDCGIAAAVEGHPCLRQLDLFMTSKTWVHAIGRLPALSNLVLKVHASAFEGDEVEGGARDAARLLLVCGWLGPCERLSHLGLTVRGTSVPAHELLAAVQAGCGRLRAFTIRLVEPPPTRDAAARALYTLVACYPQLEMLSLELSVPRGIGTSTADALSQELLGAAGVVAPLCPALGEVGVCVRESPKLTWLRPRVY